MTIAFDLNKLSGIYIETMKSPEKAVLLISNMQTESFYL